MENFNFLLYNSPLEDVSVNVIIKDETIWLTQKSMAELFGIDASGISRHLKNIFAENELDENFVDLNKMIDKRKSPLQKQ